MKLSDKNSEVHVLLSGDGDHIVTRIRDGKKEAPYGVMIEGGSYSWDRWVTRAKHAEAFSD